MSIIESSSLSFSRGCDIPPLILPCENIYDNIDTPCALIDQDIIEYNIKTLVKIVKSSNTPNMKIRPHLKAHKCPEISKLQIELSEGLSTGVCCQKVIEAEAAFSAGITDCLITNQIINNKKLHKVANLIKNGCDVKILIDNKENVDILYNIMLINNLSIKVLIEIDVGQNRCGIPINNMDKIIELGIYCNSLKPYINLIGIQTYHGMAQHVRSIDERRLIVKDVCNIANIVKENFLKNNLCCDIITGGGTGTIELDLEFGIFTEIQPGSYVLCDVDYQKNHTIDNNNLMWNGPFIPSLFLLSQVMSTRNNTIDNKNWCVIDSGLKCQSTDSGVGKVICTLDEYLNNKDTILSWYNKDKDLFLSSVGHLTITSVSDEHSILKCITNENNFIPSLKELILISPGHCDPFVNHYDHFVVMKDQKISKIWNITARSPGV